jgi:hypothetical protein
MRVKQVQKEVESSEMDSLDDKIIQETQDAGRLSIIWPVLDYFQQKFRSVYNQKNCHLIQQWTHGWVTWNLKVQSRESNKYGVLVKMVCEAASGHICKMYIYAAEGQKLEDSIITFRQKVRPVSSHLSSHFHNSVRVAEILHTNKTQSARTSCMR